MHAVGEEEVNADEREEGGPSEYSPSLTALLTAEIEPPSPAGALPIMMMACGVLTSAPPTTMSAVVTKMTVRDVSRSKVLRTQ